MGRIKDLTGEKFGKLTVINRAEDIIQKNKEGKNVRIVVWHCKCECGNELYVKANALKAKSKLPKSCGCVKQTRRTMSLQDKNDWDELYEYVKVNIMNFDENQCLSKNMVLKLKGLLRGKCFDNRKTEDMANYSYVTILNTYKFCSITIKKALINNTFESDEQKFNYVLAIVEKKINEVYERMKNAKKTEENFVNMNIIVPTNEGAEYQRKTKENTNKRLDDLW